MANYKRCSDNQIHKCGQLVMGFGYKTRVSGRCRLRVTGVRVLGFCTLLGIDEINEDNQTYSTINNKDNE